MVIDLPQKTILIHRRSSPRRIHRDLWQSNRRCFFVGMFSGCYLTIHWILLVWGIWHVYIYILYMYIFTLYIYINNITIYIYIYLIHNITAIICIYIYITIAGCFFSESCHFWSYPISTQSNNSSGPSTPTSKSCRYWLFHWDFDQLVIISDILVCCDCRSCLRLLTFLCTLGCLHPHFSIHSWFTSVTLQTFHNFHISMVPFWWRHWPFVGGRSLHPHSATISGNQSSQTVGK